MISVNDLAAVKVLGDLPRDFLCRLLPDLVEKKYSPGETIIHRGDPGYSMFMILEGTVAITVHNEEGAENRLAVLDKGEVFGEMALITGEPRSANVKAITAVRAAQLSQDVFYDILYEYPSLNQIFTRLTARRRAQTLYRMETRGLEQDERLSALFIQDPPTVDQVQGKSKWARSINEEISQLAASQENVLIHGEHGTGRLLAARLIHFRHSGREKPLLHLNCANPPAIQREDTIKKRKKDALLLEIAQECALFGHGVNAGSYARGIRKGNIELADGGTIILEHIEFMTPYVQKLLAGFLSEGTFVRKGEAERIRSSVRFIATSTMPLEKLKAHRDMDPRLMEALGARQLKMVPLRERKKDIPEIAMHLLRENNERFGKSVSGFSKDTMSDLTDYNWPLNTRELKQVVERAVAVAEEDTVVAGNVFFNPLQFSSLNRLNLLRIGLVRSFIDHRLIPNALKYVTVPFMLGLIALTLAGPGMKNPGNILVWGIWWPVLILSIFAGARSWCGYCPLPAISNGVNSWRTRFLAVGSFIEKHGIWLAIAGFAVIFLVEHASGMFTYARATGILLASILGGNILVNFLFGKRAWCKHFCPLGKMVAHFSALSVVELTGNSNICSSQCEKHECVKSGNCPMGLHPSIAAASKDCILCLSCLKKCDHRAVRIDFRIPWLGSALPRKWDFAAAVFSILLTGLIIGTLMWEGPLRSVMSGIAPGRASSYIASAGSAALITLILFLLASGFRVVESWKKNLCVSGYASLFLGFAGFFGIYFHELIRQGASLLPWTFEMVGFNAISAAAVYVDLTLLKVVVVFALLAGYATSVYLLVRLGKSYSLPDPVRNLNVALVSAAFIIMLIF